MADKISNLPPSAESSSSPVSEIDENAMKEVFGQGTAVASKLNMKRIFIQMVVFVAISLPWMDNLLKNFLPDNEIILFFTKTAVFLLVLMVIQIASM
jgi:formate hydrogenlyase subunit 4